MSIVEEPRVVVTGGGSGLGRAFAEQFAAMRGQVVIADVNDQGAEETRAILEGRGVKAWAVHCDVSKANEVGDLARRAEELMGRVDIIVNNAGVAVGGPVGAVPLSDWEWIMGINLWGVVYGCHTFIPAMKERKSGHIINVASLAAIAQAPNMGPYNVTKAGVVALSETLATELLPFGIGVTVVCPSFFETNLMDGARSHEINAGSTVRKLMKKSRIDANDVAAHAIACARKNRLYAFPHNEGRVLWAMKRASPELFHRKLLARASKRMG